MEQADNLVLKGMFKVELWYSRKINENLCLLDGLYVLEEYRNQKIASSLLKEAIDRCKKLNVKYIDINVMEKNELAKRIYKKLDFTEYEVKLRKNISCYQYFIIESRKKSSKVFTI